MLILHVILELRDAEKETLIAFTLNISMIVFFLLRFIVAIALNSRLHKNIFFE